MYDAQNVGYGQEEQCIQYCARNMENTSIYDRLLKQSRNAYQGHKGLSDFCSFPDDVTAQTFEPLHRAPADLLEADTMLSSSRFSALCTAIRHACPIMHWRQIYHGSRADTGFMDRLGCFSIIGNGAPFISDKLRLFMVYMPAHLHYPLHRHPAEEMYLVIAGNACFRRQGEKDSICSEGETVFHAHQQPHAIETYDMPMLSLVAWRNHLDTPPVLIDA